MDEVFKREALNPYERLVDLLKVLNDVKTKRKAKNNISIYYSSDISATKYDRSVFLNNGLKITCKG